MKDKSISALPLVTECTAPWNPRTILTPDKMGDAARFGNACHRLAQWHLEDKVCDVEKACQIEKVRASDQERLFRVWANLLEWIAIHRRIGWKAEAAFAYMPLTDKARLLGFGIGRDYYKYGLTADELPGTADVLSLDGDTVVIYDWKTGKSPAVNYRWQMRALGLAAAREYGVENARLIVVRVNEVEVDASWVEELDGEDLANVAEVIRDVWTRAPHAAPRPGAHCDGGYCRAREKCGAYRGWKDGGTIQL